MKSLLLFFLLLIPSLLFGQNNVQKFIDEEMKTDSLFINSVTAILAVDQNGNEIASWNPDMPLLTASTMKTITTGTAMSVLGPDYRFETKLAYSGRIDGKVLKGDLYIIGGADPTLGSLDTIAVPIDSVFGVWADALESAGIKRIDGMVIGDDRFFEDETIPDGWSWGNIGMSYGSGPSGLPFAENLSYFFATPGQAVGEQVAIVPLAPYTPDMIYINDAVTGDPKTGDETGYYVSDLARVGKFTGTYAIDKKADTLVISNKFPPSTCAYAFNSFLKNRGIKSEGATDIKEFTRRSGSSPQAGAMNLLVTTYSRPLKEIVNVTNRISNNFFAETFMKMIGKTLAGEGSYNASFRALKEYLNSNGCSTFGLTQDDGSGLSRQNYVSPRFFCNFYSFMSKNDKFADYFESLPGPGREGTLKNVLKEEPWSLKSTIHAKSGSLSNVRCYAGYVDSERGLLRFAILVNNYDCPTRMVQPKIEGFMKQLAVYGQLK